MTRLENAARKIAADLKKLNYPGDEAILVREGEDGKCFEVVWDGGPYQWTLNDPYTLFEELKGYGMPGNFDGKTAKPYFNVPKGYYAEPYNGVILQVYKD